MFKFIKALGNFTVRMYLREAKRLLKEASKHSEQRRKLRVEAFQHEVKAMAKTDESARLAATASKLSEIL